VHIDFPVMTSDPQNAAEPTDEASSKPVSTVRNNDDYLQHGWTELMGQDLLLKVSKQKKNVVASRKGNVAFYHFILSMYRTCVRFSHVSFISCGLRTLQSIYK
jgi:hypothetical protein